MADKNEVVVLLPYWDLKGPLYNALQRWNSLLIADLNNKLGKHYQEPYIEIFGISKDGPILGDIRRFQKKGMLYAAIPEADSDPEEIPSEERMKRQLKAALVPLENFYNKRSIPFIKLNRHIKRELEGCRINHTPLEEYEKNDSFPKEKRFLYQRLGAAMVQTAARLEILARGFD